MESSAAGFDVVFGVDFGVAFGVGVGVGVDAEVEVGSFVWTEKEGIIE